MPNNASGTMVIRSTTSGTIHNIGQMDLLTIIAGANVTNETSGTILVRGATSGTVNNSGQMDLNTTTASANITNNASGTIMTRSTAAGTIHNNGQMDLSSIVSGANVTNNAYATMIVRGVTSGTVYNSGQMELNTTASGANVTNLLGGEMRLLGGTTPASGVIINNHGTLTSAANGISITNSSGNMYLSGNSAFVGTNTGNLLVDGNSATINTNGGNLRINGASATVVANNSDGDLYIYGDNASITNSLGRAEISGNGARIGTNHHMHNFPAPSITGQLRITGNNAVIERNYGVLSITGNNADIWHSEGLFTSSVSVYGNDTRARFNDSSMRIQGDRARIDANVTNGRMHIIGSDAVVDNNWGQMTIDGINAIVTNRDIGSIRINGNNATVTNNGFAHIVGNLATLSNVSNTSRARIEGDNATILSNVSGALLHVIAATAAGNATLLTNHGDVLFERGTATVTNNHGGIRMQNNNARIETNHREARVEVSSGSLLSRIGNNDGTILVENGGSINDSNAINNYRIYVSEEANITISLNTATIISRGQSSIQTNRGYLEVGTWNGDRGTPANGSENGSAFVHLNEGGIIRNFSQNLYVERNIRGEMVVVDPETGGHIGCECVGNEAEITGSGLIENYGTIRNEVNTGGHDSSDLFGEVRHHARQVDTSSINADTQLNQALRFTANGEDISYPASWQNTASGRELIFEPSVRADGSRIIFNAGDDFAVYGLRHDIQERRDIAGSEGTSGLRLKYFEEVPFTIQSGANAGQVVEINFQSVATALLGLTPDFCEHVQCNLSTTNILTRHTANCALENTSAAINQISMVRANIGALHNRLEFKLHNLNNQSENTSASESRIRDTDMAKEMAELTRNNILIQAATAMLVQANALPQGVLHLLS